MPPFCQVTFQFSINFIENPYNLFYTEFHTFINILLLDKQVYLISQIHSDNTESTTMNYEKMVSERCVGLVIGTLFMRGFCCTTLWSPSSVTRVQLMRVRILSLPLALEVTFNRISSLSRQLRGLSTVTFNHGNMSLLTASLSDVQS